MSNELLIGDSFESVLYASGLRPVGVVKPGGELREATEVEVYVAPTNGHLPNLSPDHFLPRTKVSSIEANPQGFQGAEYRISAKLTPLEVYHLGMITVRDRRALELGYIKEFYPNLSI